MSTDPKKPSKARRSPERHADEAPRGGSPTPFPRVRVEPIGTEYKVTHKDFGSFVHSEVCGPGATRESALLGEGYEGASDYLSYVEGQIDAALLSKDNPMRHDEGWLVLIDEVKERAGIARAYIQAGDWEIAGGALFLLGVSWGQAMFYEGWNREVQAKLLSNEGARRTRGPKNQQLIEAIREAQRQGRALSNMTGAQAARMMKVAYAKDPKAYGYRRWEDVAQNFLKAFSARYRNKDSR